MCDIAGGMPATFPFEQDLKNEELKPLLEKYLKRNPDVSIEDQLKFWLFFGDMTVSSASGVLNYAGVHGGGSPIMEGIALGIGYDFEERKNVAKYLAGINEELDDSKLLNDEPTFGKTLE